MEHSQGELQPQVTNTSTARKPFKKNTFEKSIWLQIKILSVIQLVSGSISLVFGIAVALTQSENERHRLTCIWFGAYPMTAVGLVNLGTVDRKDVADIKIMRNWIFTTFLLNSMATFAVGSATLFAFVVIPFLGNTSCNRTEPCLPEDLELAVISFVLAMTVIQTIITIWYIVLIRMDKFIRQQNASAIHEIQFTKSLMSHKDIQ